MQKMKNCLKGNRQWYGRKREKGILFFMDSIRSFGLQQAEPINYYLMPYYWNNSKMALP